jgi:hypothetical protein
MRHLILSGPPQEVKFPCLALGVERCHARIRRCQEADLCRAGRQSGGGSEFLDASISTMPAKTPDSVGESGVAFDVLKIAPRSVTSPVLLWREIGEPWEV